MAEQLLYFKHSAGMET